MNRNSFKTKHVKDDEVTEDADFETALQSCVDRYRESPNTVALAILKQTYRMAASKRKPKKKGFGKILLELLANTEVMNMLCATGLDFQHADVYKQAASLQWTFAEMINFIIAVTHRIAMAAEEYQAAGGEGITFDVIKEFHVFSKTERLCEARTRKILMISNAIASGINLAAVGSTAAVSANGMNMQLVKEMVDNLDVGGLAVTCVHLFTDTRFIAKIKKDYVAGIIRGDFEQNFGMVLEQE
ncbi:MAG: hypothetical protein J6M46_04225 [Lachnospiraceae bacterium]|nr:hypothetical protein [Lachnospiraceae bacterium]